LCGVECLEDPSEGVDSKIQQSATSKVRVDHAVGVLKCIFGCHGHAEVGGCAVDSTNLAGGDDVADVDREREVACPDLVECVSNRHEAIEIYTTYCLHKENILLLRNLDQGLQLGGIGCEGLLAEHILASLKTKSCILVVVAVRGCNVDDIDIGVLHELLVGSICLRALGSTNLLQEVLRALRRRGRSGSDDFVLDIVDTSGLWVRPEVAGKAFSDAACGKDAPFELELGHCGIWV